MSRENLIRILNQGINGYDMSDVIHVILEYLTENNIDVNKSQLFIKTICDNPIMAINNTLSQCFEYAVNYYSRKYNIISISFNNTIINYY